MAILDSAGKLVMEAILETKTATILQFMHGLRGSLQVTFEEGTWAAWLHDLLKPHVTQVLVVESKRLRRKKACPKTVPNAETVGQENGTLFNGVPFGRIPDVRPQLSDCIELLWACP